MKREEKKRITKESISNSAIRLFSEKGYEATTVEEIAKAAGVAKGTFFNYFPSKEAVIDDYERLSLFSEMIELPNKTGPIVPMLTVALINIVHKMQYTRPLRRATLQATLSSSTNLQLHEESIAKFIELLTPLFEQGQERGEFTKRLPPATLADLTVQMFIGVLTHWCLGCGDDDIMTQIVISFEVFFKGIAP